MPTDAVPIPTYFFFGTHLPPDVQARVPSHPDGPVALAPNLLYLGSAGVVCVHGVRVVYCGGIWDATTDSAADWHAREPSTEEAGDWQTWQTLDTPEASCEALRHLLRHPALSLGMAQAPAQPSDPGSLQQARAFQFAQAEFEFQCERDAPILAARPPVDVLLTNAWPLGIDALSMAPKPDGCTAWGRAPIARLAEGCRPRYHMACAPVDEHGAFFEREPYEHPPFAALPPPDVPPITRFVSLARAANAAKQRWFTALQILPRAQLTQTPRPHGVTPSPLWMTPAPPPVPPLKRPGPTSDVDGGPRRRRRRTVQTVDPAQCWFCLSNPALEKHLIVSVGTECYVALPKGQLPVSSDASTPVPGGGHVLIVPIVHTPSVYAPASSDSLRREMRAWRKAIAQCYAAFDAIPVSWQVVRRGTRAGHTQTQVVPLAKEHAEAFDAFLTEAVQREHGAWEADELADMWEDEAAPCAPQDRQDYCYMEVGSVKRLLLLRGERFTLQFPRYVRKLTLGKHWPRSFIAQSVRIGVPVCSPPRRRRPSATSSRTSLPSMRRK